MTTVMIFHEVDDVDHWLRSPKRQEFFGPLGMTVRTFVDPDKTNRVGLIVTVPDLDTQLRQTHSEGRAYFDRRVTEGKTKKEALRALKRHVSNAVYRQLVADARRARS